jgi:hypothetical protein
MRRVAGGRHHHTDVIEAYRRPPLPKGSTGTNRHLELLRVLVKWATSSKRKLAADNPFLDGTRVKKVKRAWQRAVLVAHGFQPQYATKVIRDDATNEERTIHTALLTKDSQERLRSIKPPLPRSAKGGWQSVARRWRAPAPDSEVARAYPTSPRPPRT